MIIKWLKRIGYTLLGVLLLVNIIAAFHAYKFTHFYSNAAPVKKPEQMSGGEKLKAIFFGIRYPKTKVVDSLGLPHDTVFLKTTDSLQLESWYAKRDSAKGTVLMFHGHGSSKSGIIAEARKLYEMGYHVMLTDFRAHGNSDGNTTSIGIYESRDVKAAYDYIVAKGEQNIIIWGISMGAATALKAIDEFGLKPSKLILEMPFGSLHSAVQGRMKTMGLPSEPLSSLLTFWGGLEIGSWAFSHRPEEYAKKVSCPVLLQWGAGDKRVTEDETNALFSNISSHDKVMIKYLQSGHESLFKKETGKWVTVMSYFLNK
ncbi:alpha/beta fold hydrolase [Sediminibacterium sp.]|uniref:alpha/beta hydrolase n=1 Tax=Sediminibacterium sp. TaxID=1917865 RepID=UPI0025ECD83A|nr:alpha/beta fold hydrolase [Sediminibacterium sp.]MBW0179077.1 alpha/beta fold hydrolase [Sediminibacterium sp.]